jgi:predicted dehydrogenase
MISWGIIGFGRMGRQYVDCFKTKSDLFKLSGISSKTSSNIKEFNFYNSYEDLIKVKEIDAIYISTLNNTHRDLVILANNYNKKILCEKPLGMNFSEVQELHYLLKKKEEIFLEAIAYRAHPIIPTIFEILNDKEIGQIKKIESNFGFKVRKIKKESRLFNKKVGGGAILDLGCYPLSFFNLFDKKKDIKVIKSNFKLCETDVDIDGEIFLKIDSKIDAIGKVSLRENLDNKCRIYCENAIITIPSPWLPTNKTFIEIETKSRYFKRLISSDKNVYQHLLEASSIFFSKKKEKPKFLVGIDESLKISKIIDLWKNDRS